MFESFSERARRVVFAARLKAGHRGASTIEVTDLLFAIVMEDDDQKFPSYLQGSFGVEGGTMMSFGSHPRFIAPEVASEVLAKLESMVGHGEPISNEKDMPIAADVAHALQRAEELRKEMGHKAVEPLHLLAAILGEHGEVADLVRGSGITKEMVSQRLREEPT